MLRVDDVLRLLFAFEIFVMLAGLYICYFCIFCLSHASIAIMSIANVCRRGSRTINTLNRIRKRTKPWRCEKILLLHIRTLSPNIYFSMFMPRFYLLRICVVCFFIDDKVLTVCFFIIAGEHSQRSSDHAPTRPPQHRQVG